MDQLKRILVLTADAGFGHRSAANAVAAAIEELYGDRCLVEVLNPLEDKRTPFFLRDSQADYDKIVRNMPELYQFGYDASDATVPTAIVERALTVLLYEVMRDLIKKKQPDAIVSTYPIYSAPLSAVLAISRIDIPYFLAITDLVTVHRLWFYKGVDGLLVPTDEVRFQAIGLGIPPHRVHVTGIPINPAILQEERHPQDVRARLGWNPGMLTVLAAGSRRLENLMPALDVVNHFGYPMQLAVVTGKDTELYEQLRAVDWHIPFHLFDFVENMAELMHAADCMICKAGGLIVTESLAAGLPMILIHAIPGQEAGNASYVVEHGAGELALTPLDVLHVLKHWTANGEQLLAERSINARRLGKPSAAMDAAHIVVKAALKGTAKKAKRDRLNIIKLLTKNHVRWQESALEDNLSSSEFEQ